MDRSIPIQLRFLATVGDGARHTSCRGPNSQTAEARLLQPLQQKPLLFAFVPLCKSVGQVHYRVIASGQGMLPSSGGGTSATSGLAKQAYHSSWRRSFRQPTIFGTAS